MFYRTLLYLIPLALAGISINAGSSYSQARSAVCDGTLRPTGGKYGYSLREADRRCEGNYESKVASTKLELVSMTFGPIRYGKQDPTLAISLPPVTKSDIGEVRIRGTAIPRKTYYRMDAVLAPGEVMHWPLDAVIHPSGLESFDLGVLAWAGASNGRLYIPVNARPTAAGGNTPPPSKVMIKLVSTHDLEHLHWRLKGQGAQAWTRLDVNGSVIRAGRAVSFPLPEHLRGEVSLEFVGKARNAAGRSVLSISLWRP